MWNTVRIANNRYLDFRKNLCYLWGRFVSFAENSRMILELKRIIINSNFFIDLSYFNIKYEDALEDGQEIMQLDQVLQPKTLQALQNHKV